MCQFKYLDKDEFKDLKYLKRIHLDGNQLSVVVDNLFNRQRSLEHLGEYAVVVVVVMVVVYHHSPSSSSVDELPLLFHNCELKSN